MSYTNGLDKPSDYFTAFKWTGNGASSRALTGVGFQGNMLWSKPNTGHNHYLVDTVRGVDNKSLIPDATTAEDTTGTHGHFDSIDADGFTGTLAGGGYNFNRDALEFIAWIWKAGTTSGIVTNGSTTITPSAYSFNQTAGFSTLAYTGNQTSGAKLAHGLGVKPDMVITKSRAGASGWGVYHKSLGATYGMLLNTTAAKDDDATAWNDVEPDTVNITLGSSINTNKTGTCVAYAFAEKQGYSKFGSYVGNGNVSGSYIHLGFKPAFVIIKDATSARDWVMFDNKRNISNVVNNRLFPNSTDAQNTSVDALDFLSNGFKIRSTNSTVNVSGNTYIYMVFAEESFVSSSGVPATAR
jgi:hypothetical protein